MTRFSALPLVLALAAAPCPALAEGEAAFTLSSTSFTEGAMLDPKFGGNRAGHPNCRGANISPQLSWSNVPNGTKSIAIYMIDPEGNSGAGTIHWIAYGIDPAKGGFAEGEASGPPTGYVAGKSTQGYDHYSGPCTPKGAGPHHFIWVASATDYPRDALPAGLNRDELGAKLVGHWKATAGLGALHVYP